MECEKYILLFGKYKGNQLKDVPLTYLQWLAKSKDESKQWVLKNHPDAISNAKKYIGNRRICRRCGKDLVAIGHERSNGADHDDWKRREYHKKCWLEMKGKRKRKDSDFSD